MRTTLALALFIGLLASPAPAQDADAALKDRVAQLVEKLDAPAAEARDAAQAALVKLGPRILSLLPEPAPKDGKNLKERLAKVRAALLEEQDKVNLGASKVTIKGEGIRLSEAIKQLQARTGNPISDLREQAGGEAANPALDLDIADKPFFEALDLLAKKAGVVPNYYTGDGTIGLMPGAGADLPDAIGVDPFKPLISYAGPFRVAFKQLVVARDFQAGNGSANAQFEVAWEPRLRPLILALKASEIEIVDDKGNKVLPSVTEETSSVVLRQDNPAVEVNLNMDAPDRAAQKFASLKFKADVTVPAAIASFRFPSLAAKDAVQKSGPVSVVLEETEVDEAVWKVRVRVEMPGEGTAFESYRAGMFNNRLWLQKADGSRFEHNGGFNNTGVDGGKIGFEYLFVDAPGKPADYGLVYEAPGKVITIPLEFEFKDVPLP
jgi:hypothetical protein